MKKSNLLGLVVTSVFSLTSVSAYAVVVSGQGTWETTLQARDLDGNPATIEGYFDRVLNITWLADTMAAGTTMNFDDANAWAAGLDIYGITGWRLPFVVPTTGGTVYSGGSIGYNVLTTSGSPPYPAVTVYSEMATMFYDTLANIGQFDSLESDLAGGVLGYGLSNTGPFDNLQSTISTGGYWSGTAFSDVLGREFYFGNGNQGVTGRGSRLNAWAVHDGDVVAVPEPNSIALWSIGAVGIGLIAVRRRRVKQTTIA